MTARLNRPATRDGLFLWVMHRFAEVFEEHAVLKGGMALRLLGCPRSTVDIDYVFVPFSSKKEITDRVIEVLREVEAATVEPRLHSMMLRVDLTVDDTAIQVEVNVSDRCETVPMSTAGLAASVGQPPQVVRVMSSRAALSHKLAAWNERRLLRDLYDCYFLAARAGASPDLAVLDSRLSSVQSRLPRLRKITRMSRTQLVQELESAVAALSDEDLASELSGLLPPEELAGLAMRIRVAIGKIVEGFSGI